MDPTDQAASLRQMMTATDPRPRQAKICAVTSGKGGVGKTSLAVNLAASLALNCKKVVLLDADLGTANADILCNISHTRTLADVVTGRYAIDEVMIEAPGGFWLIPGASGLAQVASLSQFERSRLLEQMRGLESFADIILIDTGAGIGPNRIESARELARSAVRGATRAWSLPDGSKFGSSKSSQRTTFPSWLV